MLVEGLVPLTSKPVCEYESPKLMRYCTEQLSGSPVALLDAALLVDVVLVDVLRVVRVVDVVDTLDVEDDLEVLVLDTRSVTRDVVLLDVVLLVVAVPGRHWAAVV